VIAYPKEFEITSDAQTAAMILTHNHDRDLVWLCAFLPMPSRYVGLLGPKRMREKLLASLPEHGFVLSHISLAHLCNPAGLNLGAESAEEIALSITAEIKTVLSCCGRGSLRSRKAPSTIFVVRLADRAKPSRLSRTRRRNHSRGGRVSKARPANATARSRRSKFASSYRALRSSPVVVLGPNDDGCRRANLLVAPMPAHLERQRLSAAFILMT
jgi:hypothetical protein